MTTDERDVIEAEDEKYRQSHARLREMGEGRMAGAVSRVLAVSDEIKKAAAMAGRLLGADARLPCRHCPALVPVGGYVRRGGVCWSCYVGSSAAAADSAREEE